VRKIISNFKIIKPKNELDQDSISHWISKVQALVTPTTFDERILRMFGVKNHYIAKRSFFNPELGILDFENTKLFTPENKFAPSLKERSLFFQETVDALFEEFFEDQTEAPAEIIHVTCTGYVSPSAGQKIIPKKNWTGKTGLTQVYHMGCFAAMPAIKIARGLSNKKPVDIVHTELCSLHLDPMAQSPEQAVVQTLFSDGAIKYSVYSEDSLNQVTEGISILEMKEKIIPNSEDAMTWGFGENNLQMTLHRTVPSLIKENLEKFIRELFLDSGLDFDVEKGRTIFAIHPGGPKIIDQIVDLLNLAPEQVRFSKEVLFERGNMSSATLPHVWHKIVKDRTVESGTKIFSVAFGPGLTIAGFLGEKI
jgi:predicted naringenin-chalcone synthase